MEYGVWTAEWTEWKRTYVVFDPLPPQTNIFIIKVNYLNDNDALIDMEDLRS